MNRFLIIAIIFICFTGVSQETERNSILKPTNKYLLYDSSGLQLNNHMDMNSSVLTDGQYDLGFIASGLYLRPENIYLDSPFLRAYGTGFSFKYYLGESGVYIIGGPQAVIFDIPESQNAQRSYNIGLNTGVGYDINSNTQIEGKLYHSLFKNYDQNAFQPVQFVPLQPLSLGFKTKF